MLSRFATRTFSGIICSVLSLLVVFLTPPLNLPTWAMGLAFVSFLTLFVASIWLVMSDTRPYDGPSPSNFLKGGGSGW